MAHTSTDPRDPSREKQPGVCFLLDLEGTFALPFAAADRAAVSALEPAFLSAAMPGESVEDSRVNVASKVLRMLFWGGDDGHRGGDTVEDGFEDRGFN
jgi:hypothetical protein